MGTYKCGFANYVWVRYVFYVVCCCSFGWLHVVGEVMTFGGEFACADDCLVTMGGAGFFLFARRLALFSSF